MANENPGVGSRSRTFLGTAFLGLLIAGAALAEGPQREPLVAVAPAGKPLNLLLTREELRSVVRNYETRTGQYLTAPIDDEEVVVKAPGVLAPMRDVTQEPWGGLAAPFWAIMHPTQSWRIFLPIPPKGVPQEEGPIRAEDRM